MKFYNRKEELRELEHFYNKRPSMLVITGRRRVGKTELIKRMKKHAYFFVDAEKSEKILIEDFMNELRKNYLVDPLVKVSGWDEFFSLIFQLAQKEPISIAFDEFQRFIKINPSVFSQLQKYWDMKQDSKILLVFTGSSIGMIRKIFINQGSPLFKRAQNIIYLKPFDFSVISSILSDFKISDFEEKLKIYFLFGGVINYYSLMDFYDAGSLEGVYDKLILRKFAPLRNEIRDIFIEEFGREHKTYYSILTALAGGRNTKKQIGDVVEVKGTSLSPYLYDLMDILGIVDFKIPFNEKKGSKKGRYFLKDSFFQFWFRFIFPNLSLYGLEDFKALKDIISKDINLVFGKAFEDFCYESFPVIFPELSPGRWWSRKGDEIDMIGTDNKSKEILFAECKWQDKVNPEKVLAELKEKSKLVDWKGEDRKEKYAIFAKSFSKRVKGVMLYDLKDIEKVMK